MGEVRPHGFPEGRPLANRAARCTLAGQIGTFQPAFEATPKPPGRIVVFLLHGMVEAVTCTGDMEIIVIDGDAIDPDTGAAVASWPFSVSEECLCEEHPAVRLALEEIDSDQAALENEDG